MFWPSLRGRMLFNARLKAYDVSSKVEWIESTMYDQDDTVDLYDTAALKSGTALSTFRSPSDLEFLDMVSALGIRSVLDIGCGAGAFYHALSSVKPDIDYFGYDLSSAQIERAKARFGPRFAVRDIASIPQSEFAKYDAVHVYSVFSFMPVCDQLETIGRIVRSGAKLLAETGTTSPDVRYVPRSSFKNFGKAEVNGRARLTVVSFPFRRDLEKVIAGTDHAVTFMEKPYARSRLLNGSDRSGGALIEKAALTRRNEAFEKKHPFSG